MSDDVPKALVEVQYLDDMRDEIERLREAITDHRFHIANEIDHAWANQRLWRTLSQSDEGESDERK